MIGIYIITNLITNQCYVGQSLNIERRFWEHKHPKCQKSSKVLQDDILKYGIENFAFDVLEECSAEDLDDKEKYWIYHFQSLGLSYNIAFGGKGGNTVQNLPDAEYFAYIQKIRKPRPESFRIEQSERFKGEKNPMYGKKGSEKQKQAVSQRVTGTRWINNGDIQTFVKVDELDKYINDGWVLGMLPKKPRK